MVEGQTCRWPRSLWSREVSGAQRQKGQHPAPRELMATGGSGRERAHGAAPGRPEPTRGASRERVQRTTREGTPWAQGVQEARGCQGLCKHLRRRARATSRVLGARKSWEAERSRSREVGGCPGRGAPRLVLEAAWGCRATEAGKPGLQPGRQGCPGDRRELPRQLQGGGGGVPPRRVRAPGKPKKRGCREPHADSR